MLDLSLSGNRLYSTIPESIQLHKFHALDLSNNRLSGTLLEGFVISTAQSQLQLAINRLSGPLPASISGLSSYHNLSTLNVLASNVFSCLNLHEIPPKDRFSQSYSCGSNELNVALTVWLGTFISAIILLALCAWLSIKHRSSELRNSVSNLDADKNKANSSIQKGYEKISCANKSATSHATNRGMNFVINMALISRCLWSVSKDICHDRYQYLPETKKFLVTLNIFRLYAIVVGSIIIFLLVPIYVSLNVYGNAIVTYQYAYVTSMAFLHGIHIAIVIIIALFIFLLSLCGITIYAKRVLCSEIDSSDSIGHSTSTDSSEQLSSYNISFQFPIRLGFQSKKYDQQTSVNNQGEDSSLSLNSLIDLENPRFKKYRYYIFKYSLLLGFHLINLLSTIGVNVAYVNIILSSNNDNITRFDLLCIQFAVGVFKLLWNTIYIPKCARILSSHFSPSFNTQSQLIMSLINLILSPVIATTMVNRSCLYYVFNESSEETSSTALNICTNFIDNMGSQCSSTAIVNLSIAYANPFQYSYTCGTALIKSYVPVLLYCYLISGIIYPGLRYFLIMVSIPHIWSESDRSALSQSHTPWNIFFPQNIFDESKNRMKSLNTQTTSESYNSPSDSGSSSISRKDQDKVSQRTSQNIFHQSFRTVCTSSSNVVWRNTVMMLCLHISVLLTFGVTAPLLGLTIIFAMLSEVAIAKLRVGKIVAIDTEIFIDPRVNKRTVDAPFHDTNQRPTNSSKEPYSPIVDLPSDFMVSNSSILSSSELQIHDSKSFSNNDIEKISTIRESCIDLFSGPGSRKRLSNADTDSEPLIESYGNADSDTSNHRLGADAAISSRYSRALRSVEDMNTKDSWNGLFVCYGIIIMTVTLFWGTLMFDIIADEHEDKYAAIVCFNVAFGMPCILYVTVHLLKLLGKYTNRFSIVVRMRSIVETILEDSLEILHDRKRDDCSYAPLTARDRTVDNDSDEYKLLEDSSIP